MSEGQTDQQNPGPGPGDILSVTTPTGPATGEVIAPAPTIGRIVHYRLSTQDAAAIEQRRDDAKRWYGHLVENVKGVQHHTGNPVSEGLTVALIVTAVWPHEYGEGTFGVNGQALLDGNDSLWVTSAKQGDEPGQWNWPPRA